MLVQIIIYRIDYVNYKTKKGVIKMPLELTFSFSGADVTKAMIEEIALKFDLIIEYRAGGSAHLLTVRRGGVIVTKDLTESETIVLIDSHTYRAVTLSVHAIRIVRINHTECEGYEYDPSEEDWETYKLLHQWIEPWLPGAED
jgi:hypothetical protein